MHPIRIGIVGLGIMGRRYYRMLQDLEGVEVTALCVRHLDTMQDLQGAKFADYRHLCASGQVDAVLIATPHYSHPQVAIEALRCGLHVLVDKPLWRDISGTLPAPLPENQIHATGGYAR